MLDGHSGGVRPPIGHVDIGWTFSVATIAASAPVAHSACYYNKSAAACSREKGGRLPPPPVQERGEAAPTPIPDRGPDRGWAHHRHAAERPGRGSYFCRPRHYTTPRYQYIYVDIILPLSTHIYAICISVYCTLYSYLQSCVKRKSSYSMIL